MRDQSPGCGYEAVDYVLVTLLDKVCMWHRSCNIWDKEIRMIYLWEKGVRYL